MFTQIEFVCTGNNGRSPVAEAAGKSVVRTLGLEDQVTITSSGTFVELSGIPNLPELLRPYVTRWVDKGVIDEDRLDLLKSDPEKVANELLDIEAGWRTRYISENLLGENAHTRRQTTVMPGNRLILPIGNSNLASVQRIYGKNTNATISELTDYAGVGLSLEEEGIGGYRDYSMVALKTEITARVATLKALGL